MKKIVKQKICLGLLGLILSNGLLLSPAQAASIQTNKGVVTAEETSTVDALSFTQRIEKILADGDKARNAILNGKSNVKEIAETQATDKLSAKSEPVSAPENPIEPTVIQQTQQAPTPSPMPMYTETTYDFDWQGTPLSQTLYTIGKIAGKRVLNNQIPGVVFASLPQVTYDQALNYLAKVYNFNWMLDDDGNTILISTSDLMRQSKIFDVRFADKGKIKDELKSLGIDEKSIYVNDEYGSISVTGTPYQLNQAGKFITQLDHPVSQCLMIAQMIEVSHSKDLDLGMEYTLPTYTHTADSSTSNTMAGNFIDKLTFSATSQANKTLSKGKVIARPMIMSKNGQEASVYMGDSVPVQSSTTTSSSTQVTFDYKDVGTNLKMTPIINEKNGEVRLTIDANISTISKWITSGSSQAPQISSRKATTTVSLKSGQSFVIGGLMNSKDLDNLSGIPGLMDLPVLGSLFRYHSITKENTEVFIMITPYIVGADTDPENLVKGMKEHAK